METYDLESAEDMHEAHPDTFDILPLEERRDLAVGQSVKLCFLPHKQRGKFSVPERMWVNITHVVKAGGNVNYMGRLDSNPLTVRVRYKDEIVFGPENVFSIFNADDARGFNVVRASKVAKA